MRAALNAISPEVFRVAKHSYLNAESVCELLRLIAAAGLPRPITLPAAACRLHCGHDILAHYNHRWLCVYNVTSHIEQEPLP